MDDYKDVETTGHLIADSDGRPQLQTLRSNPGDAWAALYGRPMTGRERARLKRQGFHVEMVWIESFRLRRKGEQL